MTDGERHHLEALDGIAAGDIVTSPTIRAKAARLAAEWRARPQPTPPAPEEPPPPDEPPARKPPRPRRNPDAADFEIHRLMLHVVTDQAELDKMGNRFARVGGCCTSCMFGGAYDRVSDRQKRRLERLVLMLRRRGADADERLAQSIEAWRWP